MVWHADLLHKLVSCGISCGYLVLSHLFSVINGLKLFYMGSPWKNIQLLLEFLKASFLVPHLSLGTFLMMLSVILLLILMIILSTLSAIKHQICGNN